MTQTHAGAPADLAARKRELLRRRLETAGLAGTAARSEHIPPRPADAGRLPLSYAQSRMWLLQQLDPDSPAYNVCLAIRLRGPLDSAALRTALQGLVDRHEVLRTRYPATDDGVPEQVVDPAAQVHFGTIDLGELSEAEQERQAVELARRESATAFDLTADHPLRALLIRRSDQDHTLVLTVHHIAWDGGTFNALSRDLSALYRAATTNTPAGLEPLPLQYADFARWQRGTWTGERLAGHLDHWRAALVPPPRPLALPTDAPRSARPTARGDRRFHTFAPDVTERLTAFARNTGATPFMVLLAGLSALLHRVTGATDIPVGSAVMSRDLPGLEKLVGNFGNTLALRADLDGDPAFGELVERVKQLCTDAYAHQDMPFDRLVEELRPERQPGRSVYFDVMLLFLTQGLEGPRLPGVTAEWETVHNDTTQFDLSLEAFLTGGHLRIEATYRSELFTPDTVDRLLRHLETLLGAALTDPELALSRLPLMTAPEQRVVLEEWNATTHPVPVTTLTELLDRQPTRTPDAPALIAESTVLDHAELHARANRLARLLIAHGVGPEGLVGVALDRGPDLVVALLAVLKAGGAYLPLDTGYPAERLAFMIEDSAPALVVTTRDTLPAHGAPELLLDDPAVTERLDAAGAAQLTDPERLRPLRPDHPAYVIYTSGSTGRPKGAVVSHTAIVNRLLWMQDTYGLEPGDRVLQKTPASFDVSVWEFFWPLITGAALVLARPGGHRDPGHLAELIREQGVTTAHFVPSMLRVFLDDHAAEQVRGVLRRVVCSGEALPAELAERCARVLHGTELHNLYGPTEAAVDVTAWPCAEGTRSAAGSVPIGRPVWNTRTLVLDGSLRPVPAGVPGELYLGGTQLARGYLHRPGLTASRFVADPYGPPGARLYRTGDLVRWTARGALEFLGRTDDQIKIRGFRVEPGETEAAAAALPGVSQAAVTVRPEEAQLVAYVVPQPGARLQPLQVRQDLRATLPDHLLPYAVVVLDALPLTPNGKLDRAALPAPDLSDLTTATAPRTEAEAILCALFADLLGLPAVGVHDEFFALGGHSVLATRLVARIRAELGIVVPLRAVFDAPTPAALAPLLNAPSDRRSELRPVERPETVPLSSAQARLWFLYRLEGPSPTYNIHTALHLTGRLDAEALRAALNDVVARHESLRTVFPDDDGTPRQAVLPPQDVTVPFAVVPADAEELDDLMRDAAGYCFALDAEIPVRATLFSLDPDEHVLLLLVHHIATDGWSEQPLLTDLETAYTARLAGAAPDWAPLPVQYADFTLWQQRTETDDQLAYWQQALAGLPEELQLPVDRPRPAVAGHRAGAVDFTLDAEVHALLRRLAAETGGTTFMALQAALAVQLGRLGAGDDIPLGSPVAGRGDPALDDLVGLFVNTLVLRTDISGNPTFRTLLARVREADVDAYAHQDLPFEQLVDALAPTRSMGRHPLFQVMLAHQQAPDDTREFAGLALRELRIDLYTAKTDLAFHLFERAEAEGIDGSLVYSRDLYDLGTAQDMTERFVRLVGELARDPDRPVSTADVLFPRERSLLLGEWNDTAHPMPAATLTALVEEQAARTPDLTAVEYGTEDGPSLTYAELNARANALAVRLTSLGVGLERRVGVHLERSVEMVVGLLAILKAGGAFVPLEPSWPARRIAEVCRSADLTAVLGSSGDAIEGPPVVEVDLSGPVPDAADPGIAVDPEGLAYVIHTSGSTGVPKGAMIRHRAITHRLLWQRGLLGFGPSDAALFKAPLGFDISINEIFLPLVNGGRVVISEPGGERDVDYLLDTVERHRVTFTYLVSSMLDLLLEQDGFAHRARSLRHVWCGGEVLTPELFARFRAASPAVMYHGYGPAEATIGVSHVVYRTGAIRSAVSIGRPNGNTRLYVLDERLRPTPIGVPGELYAGGVYLGRGYVNDPRRTADHWVADPFGPPGERLYRTGDLVRWQRDGTLEFLGRADNQIKIRGMRVELEEIEAVLEQHSGVRRAVVVLREDAPGVKQLAGYCLAARDPQLLADLRGWLQERLPEHMVPRTLTVLDAFPLLPSGKVDRTSLPAPESTATAATREPANARERQLTELFATVLGLTAVDVDANFFALGGDSIVSIRLVTLARKAGLAISPRQIFQTPTPAGLAAAADYPERTAPAPADDPLGELDLTPVMHWAAGPGGSYDGLAQAVLLVTPPGLTHDRLISVLRTVVNRHDMLRARLTEQARLLVPEEAEVRVTRVTGLPGDDLERHLAAAADRLDPYAGHMLEAVWFEPEDFELGDFEPGDSELEDFEPANTPTGRLLLVAHHLVVDGVSWRIVCADLAEVWAGRSPSPRGTSFRTWSRLLAEEARKPARVSELPWWTEALTGARPLLDRSPDPDRDTARTLREHTLVLPADVTHPLLTTVPAAYRAGVPDLLLTTLALAAAARREEHGDLTNRSLLVGVEGHGREESIADGVDLSATVGWFTTFHPVAVDPGPLDLDDALDGGAAAGVALKRVKEQLRAVPDHGLGYGLLRHLNPDTAPALEQLPQPQVVFNYLGRFTAADAGGQTGQSGQPWELAPEAPMLRIPPSGDRPVPFALEINAVTVETGAGARLHISAAWPDAFLDPDESGRLLALWERALRGLARHAEAAPAGGLTPSDLPLVELTQDDIDDFENDDLEHDDLDSDDFDDFENDTF
ncbi:amino acid adenylation domain-containing protein [Streptomyces sp. NBC_00588]|uniref:amino acid adenylation domain-containing protein n=1 Tax=Streptomyces sp. NBC_00588 TaxID=2975784 RepID=UPI002E808DB4|nr:amino acid adenylation domain-containing protein [Streptomyces sp. NBC_00588]WUB40285.1 amino acid adenylation domain-containing protein [Streptomyces sp. NBC_00588]